MEWLVHALVAADRTYVLATQINPVYVFSRCMMTRSALLLGGC